MPSPSRGSSVVPARPRASLPAAKAGAGPGKGALGGAEAKGLQNGVPAADTKAGGRSPALGAGPEETARAS